jgi:hypothetical protein
MLVYARREYRIVCAACGRLGEVQGAHVAGQTMKAHASNCRGDTYAKPTGKVGYARA